MSMWDTNSGDGFDYGTLRDRMTDSLHPPLRDVPAYSTYATDRDAPPSEAPWPAYELTESYDIHLCPSREHVIVWVVEQPTTDVVAETRVEKGILFTPRARSTLADEVETALDGDASDIGAETASRLTEAAGDVGADLAASAFDQGVRYQARRPQVDWLLARLTDVEATVNSDGDVEWTLTFLAGDDTHRSGTWRPTYTTSELVAEYPTGFRGGYRSRYGKSLSLPNSGWFRWFSLTEAILTEDVSVPQHSDSAVLSLPAEEFEFRRGSPSTWHLAHTEGEHDGCRHASAATEVTRPLSLTRLPVPTVLCPACSQRVKQLRAATTLRE